MSTAPGETSKSLVIPFIPLDHLKAFPPGQVFDDHHVKPGLPEEIGEGSPEHVGVTW